MIQREDILSIRFLDKSPYMGSHQGMRYRLEKAEIHEEKRLLCTIWPEPFNFFSTPEDKKQSYTFSFEEAGITEAVAWINRKLVEDADAWEESTKNWDTYGRY